MPKLVSELIVSLDMKARGLNSPGYYGYMGPEFQAWLDNNNTKPHRKIMGRRTYELMNSLPDQAKDEGWQKTTQQPGFLFSRTLQEPAWPGLRLVSSDAVEFLRKLKQDGGTELRVLGSLSIMRQLVAANILDTLRLMVCPLAVPQSGVEPIFDGMADLGLKLSSNIVLDRQILLLEYQPAGKPPRNS